ncbi:MAG: Holliday junction resolvase RuvX [Balneolaceae bacterium]|nr:Holliday junction resolvase RuvX [Balneolaceae bacterium]
MKEYGRIVGIDVGTKRVGIARTDLLRTIANPYGTFEREEVFNKLEQLVRQENIKKFVVGWPLTPEGGEGDATEMVDEFIESLQQRFPDIEIVKIDERYTSKEAVELMIDAGVPKMKRREKERIDKAAAAIILQKYLDQEEY